jgi:hypothetical protein
MQEKRCLVDTKSETYIIEWKEDNNGKNPQDFVIIPHGREVLIPKGKHKIILLTKETNIAKAAKEIAKGEKVDLDELKPKRVMWVDVKTEENEALVRTGRIVRIR